MLDTMTVTKTGLALCGSFLTFLLIGWAAEGLYHKSDKNFVAAYAIDTGASEEPAEAVAEVSFEEIFAAADAAAGERLWRQCSACHSAEEGKQGTGPSLYGIVSRDKGAIEGFRYSGALASAEGTWEAENIYQFIANPRGYLPGTTMAYAGMRKSEDRANLVAYLATFGN